MSYYHYSVYPENPDALYFVEYTQFDEKSKLRWKLSKRHFFHTKAEWDKMVADNPNMWLIMGRQGHPYTLDDGEVVDARCVSLGTKSFLNFMVDALNEKCERIYAEKSTA